MEPSNNINNKNIETKIYSLIIQAPKNKPYKGSEFIPLFLSQGLKFGDMDIFHRYKNIGKDPGQAIFSIANAVEPGTFDLTNIDSFSTPAFAIFSKFSGDADFANHYEKLVRTAEFFIKELDGKLLDESSCVYSKEIHQQRMNEINQVFNG